MRNMRLFVKCRKKRIRQRKTYMICATVGFAQKNEKETKNEKAVSFTYGYRLLLHRMRCDRAHH